MAQSIEGRRKHSVRLLGFMGDVLLASGNARTGDDSPPHICGRLSDAVMFYVT